MNTNNEQPYRSDVELYGEKEEKYKTIVIDNENEEMIFLLNVDKYSIPVPVIVSIVVKRFLGVEDVTVITYSFTSYNKILKDKLFENDTLYILNNSNKKFFFII